MLVSNCCNRHGSDCSHAHVKNYADASKFVDDVYDGKAPTFEDLQICSLCWEPCEYIEETDDLPEIFTPKN